MNQLFAELETAGNLPSPPGVGMELLRITQDPDYSLDDVIQVLQKDPALTGKMLQLANSARNAGSQHVTNLNDAAMRLGIQTIRNIALGFSLVSAHRNGRCERFDYDRFWAESLARAVVARVLCQSYRTGVAAEEAFICGLLSQVGQLALVTSHPEAYSLLLEECEERLDGALLRELEREHFGISSDEITSILLRQWNLPDHFQSAVVDLWQDPVPQGAVDLHAILSAVARVGSGFVHDLPGPLDLEAVEKILGTLESWGPDSMACLWREAGAKWKDWGSIMEVKTPTLRRFDATAIRDPGEEPIRVLLIDSDASHLEHMTEALRNSTFEVLTTGNTTEGRKILVHETPEMLVVRDDLGEENEGLTFCRSLQGTDIGESTFIMLLLETPDEESGVQALLAGCNDYLPMPFHKRLFRARMGAGTQSVTLRRRVERDRIAARKHVAKLAVLARKLQRASDTDALTGLFNRRYGMDSLRRHLDRAMTANTPLSVLMLDIDRFKSVNDLFGHDAGDVALRSTSAVLRDSLRPSDVVCRWGGEEFCLVLPETTLEAASDTAERLRAAVENTHIDDALYAGNVTVSIGVACWSDECDSPEALLRASDGALYEAKNGGRNKVVAAGTTTPQEPVPQAS